ncbi:hypothetical protein ElyMa_001099400 [Elysia marginata]|uniref:Uncharacterized protein n=1 Tax=Elysia marginata TaxID=1093978 RepID=A0AAV4HUH6_9GAST|nr:hypothetical protein ElyMa_001099400 [Elysia marginata]
MDHVRSRSSRLVSRGLVSRLWTPETEVPLIYDKGDDTAGRFFASSPFTKLKKMFDIVVDSTVALEANRYSHRAYGLNVV